MTEEAINKYITKAVELINKAIDSLEQCIEESDLTESDGSTEDIIDAADELESICTNLKDR
mgnify:CR=1 FL=1